MNPRNFFTELKRRNVYKVAVAYAVVAWLLIQAASILFPTFESPSWVMKVFVAIVALGFPIALIIAWAFEMTPQGMKRTENISPNEYIPQWSARRFAALIVTMAMVAAGLLMFQLVRSKSTSTALITGAATPSQKSIAVLPFDNLSRDPDNAYFADGIQEEILTRLAKIADLKVISRTSTQQYQSKPGNLAEIAKQLGVANILEGSVQKAADQVRVNVQLINAQNDSHLWADTYDRKLTDIFGVESEIAKAIADTLQAKLSGAEKSAIAARPTENNEAHDLYLRGRYFLGKRTMRTTGDDFKRAINYFNQAIAKDPNYAPAYAGLADSYALLPNYSNESLAEAAPKARAAAEKALALDNTLAEAHSSLGLLLSAFDGNLRDSQREFERAIALNPNYAAAHYFYAIGVLIPLGEFDKGIAEGNRAVELDPFSVVINTNFGFCYLYARRYPEAIAQFRRAAELDPSLPIPYIGVAWADELSGHPEQAITGYQKAYDVARHSGLSAGAYTNLLAQCYALKGERGKALQELDQFKALAQRGEVPAFLVAVVYVTVGNKNEAIEWLQRSYQEKEWQFIVFINVNPSLDPLRGDPRFEALASKIVPARNSSTPSR